MALHPFRPPVVSSRHSELLHRFNPGRPGGGPGSYTHFSGEDRLRYRDASDDHCVYCGMRCDRLDIDHFHPKRDKPTYQCVSVVDLGPDTEKKRNDAEIPLGLPVDKRLRYEPSLHPPRRSPRRAIDPDNLAPACSTCNSPTRGRLFDDRVSSFGKHDRFPLLEGADGELMAALPSPFTSTWASLRQLFAFIDLNAGPTNTATTSNRQILGCVRASIVVPRKVYIALRDGVKRPLDNDAETLRALSAIDLLGLNRKRLAEDRYRHRTMFRGLLPADQDIKKLFSDSGTRTTRLKAFKQGCDLSLVIRALHEWPHKLALADLLLQWAGDPADFVLDAIMPNYAPSDSSEPAV